MLKRRFRILVNVSALFLVLACGTVAPAQTVADLEAWFRKGQGYYWGDDGLPKDARQAVNWYRKAAEGGHAEAQSMLGWMSEKGEGGIPKNESQAVAWYRKAAEGGHAESQWRLGYMYAYGKGVAQDDRQAVYWYRKSAEAGDAEGRRLLGIMFEEGRGGLPQDRTRAVALLRQAADQGSSHAKEDLAELQQREAVEREQRETQTASAAGVDRKGQTQQGSRKSAEAISDSGVAAAALAAGVMGGLAGSLTADSAAKQQQASQPARDTRTTSACPASVADLCRAAERGDASAQNNLGDMYLNGRGVAEDHKKAADWYRKAAEQGNANAQNAIGWMYEYGKGVAQDEEKAVYWYRKAAEQGDADGQTNLGTMYELGRGVPQDDEKAVYWYRKAAAQGHLAAQKSLADMGRAQQSSGVKQDNSKWFGVAAGALGMVALSKHLDKNKARREAYKAEQAAAYARNPSCHERCEADWRNCLAVASRDNDFHCYSAKDHCKRSCN